MAQPRTLHVQLAEQVPVDASQVIDVPYKVVPKLSTRVGRWALAFAAAAAIGLLAPPAWSVVQFVAQDLYQAL